MLLVLSSVLSFFSVLHVIFVQAESPETVTVTPNAFLKVS